MSSMPDSSEIPNMGLYVLIIFTFRQSSRSLVQKQNSETVSFFLIVVAITKPANSLITGRWQPGAAAEEKGLSYSQSFP